MIHNTQGLDKILEALEHNCGNHSVTMSGCIIPDIDSDEAKQAILQWVNDEVIGQDENITRVDRKVGNAEIIESQSWLRDIQRNILKSHGWKEDK